MPASCASWTATAASRSSAEALRREGGREQGEGSVIPWLGREISFPALESALREPNGLLAAGGDLSPRRLIAAYRRGIFPWFSEGDPILWWSPDPRMVLVPAEIKVSRSLAKTLRNKPYDVRFDTAFDDVVRACAAPREGEPGTWITAEMRTAYNRLHRLGHAHSVETWVEDRLVGGLYGVARRVDVLPHPRRLQDRAGSPGAALARGGLRTHRLPDAHRSPRQPRRPGDSPRALSTSGGRVGSAAEKTPEPCRN